MFLRHVYPSRVTTRGSEVFFVGIRQTIAVVALDLVLVHYFQ